MERFIQNMENKRLMRELEKFPTPKCTCCPIHSKPFYIGFWGGPKPV